MLQDKTGCSYEPATHLIDPTAPGGIQAMLDFHRRTFGSAVMEDGAGDGANGAGDGANGAGDGSDGAGDGSDGAGDGANGDGADGVDGADGADGDESTLPTDPKALQAIIKGLRKENARSRTASREKAAQEARAAVAQTIGKALGLTTGDDGKGEELSAEQLATKVTSSQEAARTAKVELEVYRTASTHKGDPLAINDSRSFQAKVADLDPAAADFQAKVAAAVADAVKDNPRLLAAQGAAGASSLDAAAGASKNRTPKPLEAAVASHYGTVAR